MKKHLFKNIYENPQRKTRVCSIWSKTAPLPYPSQFSKAETTPDSCSQEQRFHLPSAPDAGLLPGRSKISAFFILFPVLLRLSPKQVQLRDGAPFFCSAPNHGMQGSNPGHGMLRILQLSSPLPRLVRQSSTPGERSQKEPQAAASP